MEKRRPAEKGPARGKQRWPPSAWKEKH